MSAPCVLQSHSLHVLYDVRQTSLIVVLGKVCKGEPKVADPAPAVPHNMPQNSFRLGYPEIACNASHICGAHAFLKV